MRSVALREPTHRELGGRWCPPLPDPCPVRGVVGAAVVANLPLSEACLAPKPLPHPQTSRLDNLRGRGAVFPVGSAEGVAAARRGGGALLVWGVDQAALGPETAERE